MAEASGDVPLQQWLRVRLLLPDVPDVFGLGPVGRLEVQLHARSQ